MQDKTPRAKGSDPQRSAPDSPAAHSARRKPSLGRALAWLALPLALASVVLWPVCVPLSRDQVAASRPPLADRDDRFLFGRMFQQRDGRWHQCKTRLARWFFF